MDCPIDGSWSMKILVSGPATGLAVAGGEPGGRVGYGVCTDSIPCEVGCVVKTGKIATSGDGLGNGALVGSGVKGTNEAEVGWYVGAGVGANVGSGVKGIGAAVGCGVGSGVGRGVGASVGAGVGGGVGASS